MHQVPSCSPDRTHFEHMFLIFGVPDDDVDFTSGRVLVSRRMLAVNPDIDAVEAIPDGNGPGRPVSEFATC